VTLELTYAGEFVGATWKSPASGLWVATEAGTYLGLVERIDGRYIASDATGRELGSFEELAQAQMALDGFADTEVTTTARDIMMMKATIAMTGVTSLALGLGAILALR
jgi:hypothetical protein